MDPITAATHIDPYPYYASLRASGGLTFDANLKLWIASSAEAVCAVLRHADCHVRPPHEPVPQAIVDGPAGRVFGQLMRMNEGERQRCPRAAITPGLQEVSEQQVQTLVRARFFKDGAEGLHHAQFIGPAAVVAALLGFSPTESRLVSQLTGDFVACLSPLSNATQLEAAHRATGQLEALLRERIMADDHASTLLAEICQRFESANPDSLIANLIGLLSQTHDATAGLIGNTLLALAHDPALQQRLKTDPAQIRPLLTEVQRFDPSVQNTRRFVVSPCEIQGASLDTGDVILVLLASANRDPRLNPQPDLLLPDRPHRRSLGFGTGRHECPGHRLALDIAEATLAILLEQDVQPALMDWRYRPSVNGRIPVFSDRR